MDKLEEVTTIVEWYMEWLEEEVTKEPFNDDKKRLYEHIFLTEIISIIKGEETYNHRYELLDKAIKAGANIQPVSEWKDKPWMNLH